MLCVGRETEVPPTCGGEGPVPEGPAAAGTGRVVRAARRGRRALSGVALVLCGVLVGAALPRPGVRAAAAAPLATVTQVYDLILHRYAGRVTAGELVAGAIHGMLASVGDPFSTYFTPAQDQAFSAQLNGVDGVGISIMATSSGDVVESVVAGGPAQQAGLRSGDLLVAVNGKPTAGLPVSGVAALVQGPVGSRVTLTYLDPFRNQARVNVTLTRASLQAPTVFGSSPAPGVGLIRITEFSSDTAAEFDRVYAQLQRMPGGLHGLILDLRNNPGGYVSAAVHIAGALAPPGPLFQVVAADGQVTRYTAAAHAPAPPIVVLVNGMSASAAEIVAGSLQYRHAAELVGSRTYGKGSVQELFALPGGGAVKLTVEHDELPNGRSWNGVGLRPDVAASPAPSPLAHLPTLAAVGARGLRRGMIGLDVLGLQQRLAILGNYLGKADGIYGPGTRASVQVFQEQHGLPVTGRMGAADWRALGAALAARIGALEKAPVPDTVLRKGLQVLAGLMAHATGGG